MHDYKELDWVEIKILDLLSQSWQPSTIQDTKDAMPKSMTVRFDIALAHIRRAGHIEIFTDKKTGFTFIDITDSGREALEESAADRVGRQG